MIGFLDQRLQFLLIGRSGSGTGSSEPSYSRELPKPLFTVRETTKQGVASGLLPPRRTRASQGS